MPASDGLPPRSALSARQRIVVEASAIGDLALRTSASSLLSATVAPAVVRANLVPSEIRADERSNLKFYAELGGRA